MLVFSSKCSEFRQISLLSPTTNGTPHDQFRPFILEKESPSPQSNGSQFRQVYQSFSLQFTHSQILHENRNRTHIHQTELISNWAYLFIISFHRSNSLIPMKHDRNCNHHHSIFPFQSLPKKAHSQSHTRNNQRRNNNQSSILSVSHNPSNRNDDLNRFHLSQDYMDT